MQKKILFIPYWIKAALQRYNQPFKILLNLDTLKEYLTSEDIAGILYLNQKSQNLFKVDSMISEGDTLYEYNKISTILPLIEIIQPSFNARLFSPNSKSENYTNAYEVIDIDLDTILVVIYPGHFITNGVSSNINSSIETNTSNINSLIRDLLKLFYAYSGFDDMARRQIFKTYLTSL